jgi:tetratricopeptide (TPR) repeat protein/O-antigen ligase
VLLGLFLWVLGMVAERRIEWRRTALDLPLALLVALVFVQLALGNRPLAAWALAPSGPRPELPVELPTPFFTLGTVSPAQTTQSVLLFLTYVSVYVLVVNLIRERHQLDRLVRTLLLLGGLLAFLGLLDYLAGEAWLIRWRDYPFTTGRLSGSFVNPDRFAAWLAMLVSLGLGYLAARRRPGGAALSLRVLLLSREGREQAVRRYLPFVSLGVMALALVFTLSRGGLLSLLLTLVVLLVLLGALGRTRWSLVVVGALLAVMVGYGAWIGLGPFLARWHRAGYVDRWVLSHTTLLMLAAFPLWGVGLGAYPEIYFRYQPRVLNPGQAYVLSAHNDLLQFAVELGLVGTVLGVFAVWRVGRDLFAAHLFGRGRCPVGGGEADGAQRSDPFSVGIALGALGSVLALFFHSGADSGARVPANGILAAACLGIATVALHTRFSAGGERLLTSVRTFPLGAARTLPVTVGASALALSLALVPVIIRPARVEAKLQEGYLKAVSGPDTLIRVEEALALDARNGQALGGRARLRLTAAQEAWNSGLAPGGRVLVSGEERRGEGLALLNGAIRDFQTALSLTPSDPFLHEQLAWAYELLAMMDSAHSSGPFASALTHLHRAIALAPENAFLYRSLAALAVTAQEPLLELGLGAARGAVERDLDLLADLVDRFLPLGLSEPQWVALVPDSAPVRLELAALLEADGLLSEAAGVYRRAVELAPPGEKSLGRWMLARLLLREGDERGALSELDAALAHDLENPELYLARAQVLAARGDPAALEAHRVAVLKAEAWERQPAPGPLPFAVREPRIRALVSERLGPGGRVIAVRYRRALGQYLTDRKLWDQALREWERVLAEAAQDPLAHFSRGLALDGLGAREPALEAFRTAVSLDGGNVRFRLRLARGLWESEQYYQAMNEWRAVITQDPGNVEAIWVWPEPISGSASGWRPSASTRESS